MGAEPRLILVDTVDALPGLLPLHAWSALMSSEVVLVGDAAHPFVASLEANELRYEVVSAPEATAALSRTDLLSGLSPSGKRRAQQVVDRTRELGEVTYLFGPSDADAFTRVLGMEAARAGVEVEVVYFGLPPKGVALLDLVAVEARLLAPGGCPWDAEQTHASLARYAVEEVYELLDAITSGDADAVREELGDVLLQVVFHAEMATRAASFDIDDVARAITDKLVRRHPHVFAGAPALDSAAVGRSWEALKAEEKPERTGPLDGVVVAQPALQYVEQLQSRAARTGFDWSEDREAAERVRLELDEFLAAETGDERTHEVGDLLMSVVGLARRHRVDPELALRAAAERFRSRFEAVVASADRPLGELSREDWLALWGAAKAASA